MKKLYLIIFMLVVGLATTGFAADKSFKAMLSGSECVPAVKTMAKGEATFTLSKDSKELSYNVTVTDIENVTAAHIHLAKMGKNGPPVATIDTKGKKAGKFSGILVEDKTITNELRGSLMGKTVKDLIMEIKTGNVYLNVYTDKYADEEIRGQIK